MASVQFIIFVYRISSPLTLVNHAKVWGDPEAYAVMGNSVAFAAGSAMFGLAIAVALAWFALREARSDLTLQVPPQTAAAPSAASRR